MWNFVLTMLLIFCNFVIAVENVVLQWLSQTAKLGYIEVTGPVQECPWQGILS